MSSGTEATSAPITYLVWYLTQACNLRCSYCYLEKKPLRSDARVGRACVDFLLRRSPPDKPAHLRFFGGEALMELDLLEEVAIYARHQSREVGRDITMDLVTNGVLLDEEARDLLLILGIGATVSVDGARQTMTENRGLGDAARVWSRFETNVRSAVELGIVQQFRMTASPGAGDIAEDIRFVAAFGPAPILLATATNVPWTEVAMEAVYAGVEEFCLETLRSGRPLQLKETNRLLFAASRPGEPPAPRPRFCEAGDRMLAVDTEGRFLLCHRMTHRMNDSGMGDLWDGVDEVRRAPFAELDSDRFHHPICETCHAREFCAGSCMAANKDSHGDLFYPEERHCLDLRAHVSMVRRLLAKSRQEGWPAPAEMIQE